MLQEKFVVDFLARIVERLAWGKAKHLIGILLSAWHLNIEREYILKLINEDIVLYQNACSKQTAYQFARNVLEMARFINGKYDPVIQANIMVYERDSNALQIRISTGFRPLHELVNNVFWGDTKRSCHIRGARKGRCSECFTSGQMIIVEDVLTERIFLTEHQQRYLGSLICYPIRDCEHRILGILNVDSPFRLAFARQRYDEYLANLGEINEIFCRGSEALSAIGVRLTN